MVRVSRRKLAAYVADKLESGAKPKAVLGELAAYLYETKRLRELELIVRDIEAALASRGVVLANVTSAHPLSTHVKAEITALIGVKKVQFRESIDPNVLGGVRVEVPGARFDGTIRRKLALLKAKQL